MDFKLNILGTGAAVPAHGRFSAAQVLETHNKSFLIDCADGTQHQFLNCNVKSTRLSHIFISHLHGDHCFGIIALLATLGMTGHTNDIYIHSHPDLEPLLRPMLDYFCFDLDFKIYFEPFDPLTSNVIYEDRSVTVTTIPLVHSMPTCGFLFREKDGAPHLRKEMLDFYNVPLSMYPSIKEGADFVTTDGCIVPNERLTTPPSPAKSYAYCSDTRYTERIIPIIEGVDCLYHEATYASAELPKARKHLHSTAAEAATIAQKAGVKQLIIGHYSKRYDTIEPLLREAQAIFPATTAAYDGLKIRF